MKAIIQTGYGSPDGFELREIAKPGIKKDDDVLVRIHAAALHAGDVFIMRGVPYMTRMVVGVPKPSNYVPGYDGAGIVEAVGKNVSAFKPGDEVYGSISHSCAEYVITQEKNLERKPANLLMQQAGAVATSAIAALHGIRDAGKVQPGQKVLINGASGGVGTYAVQIAKAYGADVTGVCSGRNAEMVRSIGADHVIDYTQENFTKGGPRYDLILDNVANHPLSACRKALTPGGAHIPNSGQSGLGYIIKAAIVSRFVRQQGGAYFATTKPGDLKELKELIEAGKVTPVIDRIVPFDEFCKAMRHLNEGHAQGKVVISVAPEGS
ncbi:NAD(P)-dependent alcohol dehydrogenase [Candidatus Bipolaricaulota bacterium]